MSSKKTHDRQVLLNDIVNLGFPAAMKCSYCQTHSRNCIMSTRHTRCSECIRVGRSKCDGKPEFLDGYEALARQEEKLEEEEEEAMAKILRLRKQKKFLQRRRNDMMARGFKSLQELDEAEEKEREKEKEMEKKEMEEEAARPASLPTSSGSDSALDLGLDPTFFEAFPPDHEMWATLGFGGGTPEVPPSTG
ncbi:hypothetical protein HYALB_00014081 [Hymenoscyphus albidus]|uniref:Uncharacterized protein n=1 Tax=Hymenoscyphus albidus TaxID=595503 RepID=A0A9N9L9N2_9HELO|nr:hypothetical protein HYALB_00014081 [Hymenoscyphus albidus]